MNVQSKLLGACDALMLGLMAAVQLGVVMATLGAMTAPRMEMRASVEIRQLEVDVTPG